MFSAISNVLFSGPLSTLKKEWNSSVFEKMFSCSFSIVWLIDRSMWSYFFFFLVSKSNYSWKYFFFSQRNKAEISFMSKARQMLFIPHCMCVCVRERKKTLFDLWFFVSYSWSKTLCICGNITLKKVMAERRGRGWRKSEKEICDCLSY